MIITLIILSFLIGVFIFFKLLISIRNNTQTENSFKIGENFENDIFLKLNNIASNINASHLPKGIKGADFILDIVTENGNKYVYMIEAKNVKTYNLEWERKLNEVLIETGHTGYGLIVTTKEKNQRKPSSRFWISDINKKIIIIQPEDLVDYIKNEAFALEEHSKKIAKMSISQQQEYKAKAIANDIDIKFESFLSTIKRTFIQINKKFSSINSNISKMKKIKLTDDSKMKKYDIAKIENISNQIEDLTMELLDELE